MQYTCGPSYSYTVLVVEPLVRGKDYQTLNCRYLGSEVLLAEAPTCWSPAAGSQPESAVLIQRFRADPRGAYQGQQGQLGTTRGY